MTTLRKIIFGLLLVIWIFGNLVSTGASKQDLSISLQEKVIQGLNSQGLTLAFYCSIRNSSDLPYYLVRYDYRVMINEREYLSLQTTLDEPLRIAPQGETLVSLPLKISYSLLFQAFPGMEAEDKVPCYLTGNMVFASERRRDEKIPFTFSGAFPIFRDPEVELRAIRLNDLTIGGADLTFEFKFSSQNGFELLVDRIFYKLFLGDRTVAEGDVKGDKNIPARGDKVFSLALLLNFFEVGKEVYDALRQPSTLCRFLGEIEVNTIWGRLKIPFDRSEKISIVKVS